MPESSAPTSGAALMARIKPVLREEKVKLCLRPDLLDAWEDASEALEAQQVADSTGRRLSDGISKESRALAEQVAELEAQIEDLEAVFLLRAMSKDEWQALTADNPPREGNQVDAFYGSNRDAVLNAAVRKCLIDPVFEDCEVEDCDHTECGTWQAFVKVCNPSEWTELRNAANRVNSAVVDAPKSALASRILSSSASGSKPRKRGASARGSSTAG